MINVNLEIDGYKINKNPFLREHRNLTHQMLLSKQRPDFCELLVREAYEQTPEYKQKQQWLALDDFIRSER